MAWFAARGITIERVLSDNGSAYVWQLWRDVCAQLGIKHTRTRPYRPQTNGKIERFHRTLTDGWAYARCYESESERRQALPAWLHEYNHHRPHTACGNKPHITRLTNLSGQYKGLSAELGLPPFGGHRLSGRGGLGVEALFERYWADLAERAVPSPAVVNVLDPRGDGGDGLGQGAEVAPLVVLGLQSGPEALLLGVVPALTGYSGRIPLRFILFGGLRHMAAGCVAASSIRAVRRWMSRRCRSVSASQPRVVASAARAAASSRCAVSTGR